MANDLYVPGDTNDRELTPEERATLLETLAIARGITSKPWIKTKALLT